MFQKLMQADDYRIQLILNLSRGGAVRFECISKSTTLEVIDTWPHPAYHNAEELGIQKGDIIRSIAGISPFQFIDTIKKLVPYPRTVAFGTNFVVPFPGITDAQVQSNCYWFDVRPDTTKIEIESPGKGQQNVF